MSHLAAWEQRVSLGHLGLTRLVPSVCWDIPAACSGGDIGCYRENWKLFFPACIQAIPEREGRQSAIEVMQKDQSTNYFRINSTSSFFILWSTKSFPTERNDSRLLKWDYRYLLFAPVQENK